MFPPENGDFLSSGNSNVAVLLWEMAHLELTYLLEWWSSARLVDQVVMVNPQVAWQICLLN
jgi:hypothetical protein